MSKESISSDYRSHCHERYLSGIREPSFPRTIVTGVADRNIGMAITDQLQRERARVYPMSESNWNVTWPTPSQDMLCGHDHFVFCHGATSMNWIEDQQEDDIARIIDVNLTSSIRIVSAIAQSRVASPRRTWTKIVFIGSMAHQAVLNGSAPYCAAKAGLQHFVRCAAYELAPKGVQVFCVNPSNVEDTPMTDYTIESLARYRGITLEEAAAYWASDCPMGSWLQKHQIAEFVADLLLRDRRYLSGSAINFNMAQR